MSSKQKRKEAVRKQAKFDFLAHYVEPWNWLLPIIDELNKTPAKKTRYRFLAPLYWSMSISYLWGGKAFDVIDRYNYEGGNGRIMGRTTLLRNFGYHFFLKGQRDKIRRRILAAVLDAQKEGVDVIGLGALIKAEWLTEGGKRIVEELGNELKTPIVHGDTLTAATVIMQAKRLSECCGISTPVFVTGATSKIGRAVVLALAADGIPVIMHTESPERFAAIRAEANGAAQYLSMSATLDSGKECRLWITGKAIPSGRKLLAYIPEEAAVLNFSVPNPVPEKFFSSRPDVRFCEGGLLAYDPEKTTLRMTMRMKPGITYACHAGTMVHAYKGWRHHEVGHVDMTSIPETWQGAVDLGFYLPPL